MSNQDDFNLANGRTKDIHWHVTEEGRDFDDRHTFSETKYPNAWGSPFTLLEILNGVERRSASLQDAVTGLTELVKQLSVAQGVVIDTAAIAKAVNDDAANRMKG